MISRDTIRCCISCILPCGSLDVIRIVHVTGHVDEIPRPISAAEVLRSNPKHVLRAPSSLDPASRSVILPPNAELRRGKIYFLVPLNTPAPAPAPAKRRKKRSSHPSSEDRYLSEILSEKVSEESDRRRGRDRIWRPRLESIEEIVNDV